MKWTRLRSLLLCLFLFQFCSPIAFGQTSYIVTNTNDSGDGSFDAALHYAWDHAGDDTIKFNIPGNGPFYIKGSAPIWDDGTVIDATTQPDFYLGKIVYGTDAENLSGLYVSSDDFAVFGLVADEIVLENSGDFRIGAAGKGNRLSFISVDGSDNGIIQGNFIGTNATGTESLGTNGSGIYTTDCEDMLIGGDLPEDGNLVSGKSGKGMELDEPKNFHIKNNKIGTDITGTYAIPNEGNGIWAVSHHAVFIGGSPAEGNLISGNLDTGIRIISINNDQAAISGNKVGTDITGTLPLRNEGNGMQISGANVMTIEENIVGFHPGYGIAIFNPINQKILRNNSLFCNEEAGYFIEVTDVVSIDSISMNLIMGTGPADSDVYIYRADFDDCLGQPCQGKYYVGTTNTNSDGHWELSNSFVPGRYMANAIPESEITSNISACVDLEEEIVSTTNLQGNDFQLFQNEPNPFDNQSTISIYAPKQTSGVIRLLDQMGRTIYLNEQIFNKGLNTISINQKVLPSKGLYFYCFKTDEFYDVKKMVKR